MSSNSNPNIVSPTPQKREEKDDYSLSYIFTEGLRYCSEHKRNNRPMMPLNQVVARNTDGGNSNVQPCKQFSSTTCIQSFRQDKPNRQVEGDSTQKVGRSEPETELVSYAKEWETLEKLLKPSSAKFQKTDTGKKTLDINDLTKNKDISTLGASGSSSSSSTKMKGILECSARPPTCPALSRFAPVNNSDEKKNVTMTERDHPMNGAEKENLSDFIASDPSLVRSSTTQSPTIGEEDPREKNGEGEADMNFNIDWPADDVLMATDRFGFDV